MVKLNYKYNPNIQGLPSAYVSKSAAAYYILNAERRYNFPIKYYPMLRFKEEPCHKLYNKNKKKIFSSIYL